MTDDARRKFSATATAMDDKIGSMVNSLKGIHKTNE